MEGLTLQDLEVLDILVVGVGIELDAMHRQVEEDAVKDLAQRSSRGVDRRVSLASSQLLQSDELLRMTDPVPHCSTLVMLSWRRLLSHWMSSCLVGGLARLV